MHAKTKRTNIGMSSSSATCVKKILQEKVALGHCVRVALMMMIFTSGRLEVAL